MHLPQEEVSLVQQLREEQGLQTEQQQVLVGMLEELLVLQKMHLFIGTHLRGAGEAGPVVPNLICPMLNYSLLTSSLPSSLHFHTLPEGG